ncbi:hypothetical protein LguiA_033385 [Lonicera macranthoides]
MFQPDPQKKTEKGYPNHLRIWPFSFLVTHINATEEPIKAASQIILTKGEIGGD